MSSSRIIKSKHLESHSLRDFNFLPVTQAVCTTTPCGPGGFVPLDLFDPSEISGGNNQPLPPQPEETQELQGVLLTEEELDQRLRESFQSGLQEGKNLAERGLLNVFRSLRTAAEGVHALREKIIRESEDELVMLVMLVARKVILREVAQDRRILSNVVEAAIADLNGRDEITIRLNPDDYALVTTSRDEYLRKELMTDLMQLKADSSVLPGSCQIDTLMGTIDAGIDAQLDEIFRRMLEERSMSLVTGT